MLDLTFHLHVKLLYQKRAKKSHFDGVKDQFQYILK